VIPPPVLAALGSLALDALAVAGPVLLARVWVFYARRLRASLSQ